MATCDYCGESADDGEVCSGCGRTFCADHAKPLVHNCPTLERTAEDADACSFCGEETDLQRCDRCREPFCAEHVTPIVHQCPVIEDGETAAGGAGATDVADPGTDVEQEDVGPTAFLTEVVVVTVLLMVLGGLVAGVVSPGTLGGLVGGGGDGGDGGGETVENLDDRQYRQFVFGTVNAQRETNGTDRLSTDQQRQRVVDAVAADMARYDYFRNGSAPDSPAFNVTRRLRQAGHGCTNETGGDATSFLLRTYYDREVRVDGRTERYTDSAELAEATVSRMADQIGGRFDRLVNSDALSVQAMGVHVDDDNAVYVVYLAC